MKTNDLKSGVNRDLKCMSFDELRLEAESLLQKYNTSQDRDEMRSISNRFSEIDAMLEDYQRQINADLSDGGGSGPVDIVAIPDNVETFTGAPTKAIDDKQEAPVPEAFPFDENEPEIVNDDEIPMAETVEAEDTPDASEPTVAMTVPVEESPPSGLPEPTKKPTSALDLMPMPKAELSPEEEQAPQNDTAPSHNPNASKKNDTRHYEGNGDLHSALQSVWQLVSDADAPDAVVPSPLDTPVEAPNETVESPGPLDADAKSNDDRTAEHDIIPPLPDVAESESGNLATKEQEESKAPEVPPIPESPAEESKVEPTPLPQPVVSVANDIPKSVSEELPKFETTPKCRICSRCGRETRLSRETCENCSYVDASLGILDSVIAGDVAKVEEILLAKPLVITTRTSKHEWTLLHMAASGGNARMVEMLIQKGISINAQNKNGKTPLHYAAAKGHARIVKILLDNLADTEPEYMGETAIAMARSNGHAEVIKLLEAHGG